MPASIIQLMEEAWTHQVSNSILSLFRTVCLLIVPRRSAKPVAQALRSLTCKPSRERESSHLVVKDSKPTLRPMSARNWLMTSLWMHQHQAWTLTPQPNLKAPWTPKSTTSWNGRPNRKSKWRKARYSNHSTLSRRMLNKFCTRR